MYLNIPVALLGAIKIDKALVYSCILLGKCPSRHAELATHANIPSLMWLALAGMKGQDWIELSLPIADSIENN